MTSIMNRASLYKLIIQLKTELIKHGGEMPERDFIQIYKYNTVRIHIANLEWGPFARAYSQHFKCEHGYVSLVTDLIICPDHCTEDGCPRDESCPHLHMCRFHLLHRCQFQNPEKPGTICKFGHDLDDMHTKTLLEQHALRGLSVEQLRVVFRNNRCLATIPRICKFYNVGSSCTKDDFCPDLHLCRHFIFESCKFGSRCMRSHNVHHWKCQEILTSYGYTMDREILTNLRSNIQWVKQQLDVGQQMLHGAALSGPSQEVVNFKYGIKTDDQMPDTKQSGDAKICVFNLSENSECRFGKRCRNIHSSTFYAWQLKLTGSHAMPGDKWQDLSKKSNDDIHLNYIDPSKDTCYTEINL